MAAGAAMGAAFGSTSNALAQDTESYVGLGVFATYTFGDDPGWGLGLDLRAGLRPPGYDASTCTAPPESFYYGGGALRLEWYPRRTTRLLVAAQGGRAFAAHLGGHLELGVGYRFGEQQGLDTLVGAEFDASLVALALHLEPLRGEASPALGVVVPYVSFPSSGACMVGRPQRSLDGFAPLPALAMNAPKGDDDVPMEAVAVWSTRARTELASVPAFQQLAQQLRVVGAPADLITRSHTAARQELHHAMLAASQCAQLAGRRVVLDHVNEPARSQLEATAGLVRLAVESWVDGCLGEGVAAAAAREEASLATEPALRAAQMTIARDEAQHAELAWDVLEWTLATRQSQVTAALRATAYAATAPVEGTTTQGFPDHGILSSARYQELAAHHRTHSLRRLHALLG